MSRIKQLFGSCRHGRRATASSLPVCSKISQSRQSSSAQLEPLSLNPCERHRFKHNQQEYLARLSTQARPRMYKPELLEIQIQGASVERLENRCVSVRRHIRMAFLQDIRYKNKTDWTSNCLRGAMYKKSTTHVQRNRLPTAQF